MSKDLFAPKTNGHSYLAPIDDPFRFIVTIFNGSGASDTIIKANEIGLESYYPLRFNSKGEPKPLWANYLFLEFREFISIELCRSSSKFLKIISARNPSDEISYPILIRRNAIAENMRLIKSGHFNPVAPLRAFHGRGSLIKVTGGALLDRRVRLEADISPDMPGYSAVAISIGNWRGTIEIFKLAL